MSDSVRGKDLSFIWKIITMSYMAIICQSFIQGVVIWTQLYTSMIKDISAPRKKYYHCFAKLIKLPLKY